jgi:hypothetical protein
VVDNEAFVTLIRVAQKDAGIRKQLQAILAQPAFHRKSLLNTFITDMRFRSAPAEFVAAITCLLDDEVAEKVHEMINKEE